MGVLRRGETLAERPLHAAAAEYRDDADQNGRERQWLNANLWVLDGGPDRVAQDLDRARTPSGGFGIIARLAADESRGGGSCPDASRRLGADAVPERRRVGDHDVDEPRPSHEIGHLTSAVSSLEPRAETIHTVVAHRRE